MGIPPKKATTSALVIIKVLRNKHRPDLVNLPSTARDLAQATGVGTRVFTVEAIDSDTARPFNQLSFAFVGDDNGPTYFDISDEGVVSVRRDLRTAPGTETQYKVRNSTNNYYVYFFYSAVPTVSLLMALYTFTLSPCSFKSRPTSGDFHDHLPPGVPISS